jgi:hypothetical protein
MSFLRPIHWYHCQANLTCRTVPVNLLNIALYFLCTAGALTPLTSAYPYGYNYGFQGSIHSKVPMLYCEIRLYVTRHWAVWALSM